MQREHKTQPRLVLSRQTKRTVPGEVDATRRGQIQHESVRAFTAAELRAVPTFIATDLLEKLIEDRDALAVRKVVTEGRHT
jgi:hypothetical protein